MVSPGKIKGNMTALYLIVLKIFSGNLFTYLQKVSTVTLTFDLVKTKLLETISSQKLYENSSQD